MGLNLNSVKLLFEAKAAGVCFEKTLTLGRQSFYCSPEVFNELKSKFGYPLTGWVPTLSDSYFAEPFFHLLGAREVGALDNSAYEGAQFTHDMNRPIPSELFARFDAVIDGGTLEHIFNFPVAIRNCMEMIKCGGHLLMITPINNYCGHGFYQFSPELFYRILSSENGFSVERVVAWEEGPSPEYFAVDDPAVIRRRIELVNQSPVLMFIQAKKIRQVQAFSTPQQSDYVILWEKPAAPARSASNTDSNKNLRFRTRLLHTLMKNFPEFINALFSVRHKHHLKALSLWQEPGFRRLGKLSPRNKLDRLPPITPVTGD